mmetsp:Transcript_125284/g.350812  ORF Transcript_125284/g.350812 Transcript_125284/m.350812 type:complete len:96 (-) Transcript_125284:6-293(-)
MACPPTKEKVVRMLNISSPPPSFEKNPPLASFVLFLDSLSRECAIFDGSPCDRPNFDFVGVSVDLQTVRGEQFLLENGLNKNDRSVVENANGALG